MTTVEVLERMLSETIGLPDEEISALIEAAAWAKVGEWMKQATIGYPRCVEWSAMHSEYFAITKGRPFTPPITATTIVELAAKLEGIK